MAYQSELLTTLTARGYLHQATDAGRLDALATSQCVPAYIGFDCTADSLHVGSLIQIMMLRALQQSGHKPIVLMGGGTTKIGDPSGKDSQRPMLSDQDIAKNKNGIRRIFEKFLAFGDGTTDAVMADNAEWLDSLQYIPFLRNYGTHVSVKKMLAMESVKLRLDREQPLSFLEFNYAILQAYDFMELRRRYGCLVQMGGSDQWGNIVTGIDLIRRIDRQETFGITSPLITTASGDKMGKSAQGAIWLSSSRLPVWDFWQYWRNTEDQDVGRFLRLFTELPLDEIARLEKLEGNEINHAKIILANAVTALCHSPEEAAQAESAAKSAFGNSGEASGLPHITAHLPIGIVAVLRQCKFAATNGEARRLINGGGVRINDRVIDDSDYQISTTDKADASGGDIKISAGKKRHAMLVAQ